MSRSPSFARIVRALEIARFCNDRGLRTADGLDLVREVEATGLPAARPVVSGCRASRAGLEGLPSGNLRFAGEHANSFYEWQGFMEGAALSGLDAAAGILRAAR